MIKIQGKPNKGLIISFLVSLILTAIAVTFVFSSCSDARMVAIHLKKAEKHGGKIVCDTTFIEVPKLVKGKDGKDSLIYVSTPVPCKPCQPCETKREIKWKYKYDLKRQKARDAFIIDSLIKYMIDMCILIKFFLQTYNQTTLTPATSAFRFIQGLHHEDM